ncbi:MAG: hypothetical protein SGPRY_002066 [Prymnesium sp.]
MHIAEVLDLSNRYSPNVSPNMSPMRTRPAPAEGEEAETLARMQTELFEAISQDDESEVELLLEARAEINGVDWAGWTPLLRAAEQGHTALLKALVGRGADMLYTNDSGVDALFLAAGSGQLGAVEALVEAGAPIDPPSGTSQTPLLAAVGRGQGEVVEWLLEQGANPRARDSGGRSLIPRALHAGQRKLANRLVTLSARYSLEYPLDCACVLGDTQRVGELLASNADPDGTDPAGRSHLIAASGEGSVEVVNLLLSARASTGLTDGEGSYPLSWACARGHLPVAQLLLRAGASINARNARGESPLFVAAARGHNAVVRWLIEEGADPGLADGKGCSPLGAAAVRGHVVPLQALLEASASPDSLDSYGSSPLLLASEMCQMQAAAMLLHAGASVNLSDSRGRSPLHAACELGAEDLCLLLLRQKGVRVDSQDEWGETALSLALVNKKPALAMAVLEAGGGVATKDVRGRTTLSKAVSAAIADGSTAPSPKGERGAVVTGELIGPYLVIALRLLAAGADPRAQDEMGESALSLVREGRAPHALVQAVEAAAKHAEAMGERASSEEAESVQNELRLAKARLSAAAREVCKAEHSLDGVLLDRALETAEKDTSPSSTTVSPASHKLNVRTPLGGRVDEEGRGAGAVRQNEGKTRSTDHTCRQERAGWVEAGELAGQRSQPTVSGSVGFGCPTRGRDAEEGLVGGEGGEGELTGMGRKAVGSQGGASRLGEGQRDGWGAGRDGASGLGSSPHIERPHKPAASVVPAGGSCGEDGGEAVAKSTRQGGKLHEGLMKLFQSPTSSLPVGKSDAGGSGSPREHGNQLSQVAMARRALEQGLSERSEQDSTRTAKPRASSRVAQALHALEGLSSSRLLSKSDEVKSERGPPSGSFAAARAAFIKSQEAGEEAPMSKRVHHGVSCKLSSAKAALAPAGAEQAIERGAINLPVSSSHVPRLGSSTVKSESFDSEPSRSASISSRPSSRAVQEDSELEERMCSFESANEASEMVLLLAPSQAAQLLEI